MDVDGEVFNVKISPVMKGNDKNKGRLLGETPINENRSKDLPAGALISGMPGIILSIDVKVGDKVKKGDLLAVIESMKMKRLFHSPRNGKVKEIMASEGETVDTEDVLMVVA